MVAWLEIEDGRGGSFVQVSVSCPYMSWRRVLRLASDAVMTTHSTLGWLVMK